MVFCLTPSLVTPLQNCPPSAISHAAKSPPVEMRFCAFSRSPSCARDRISSSDNSRRENSSGHSSRTLYAPLPSGRAPEYVFLAAVLQLQIAQEYLTLWRSVSGRYAAAVRRHLSAAPAALYGSAGEAGCLAALRERCAKHPAFSDREGAQALARIDDLLRRYASLFPDTVSPAVSFPETAQCIADTESALRDIRSRLFTATGTQAGSGYFSGLHEHR